MQVKNLEVKFKNDIENIPYYVYGGKNQGPSIFISAGMHGNEINGVYLIKNFVEWLNQNVDEESFVGTIFIVPLLNPSAFAKKRRSHPIDNRDLNRAFDVLRSNNLDSITSNNQINSISEQIAFQLTEEIFEKCIMGIDFHDSGKYAQFVPHTRIHKNDLDNCVSCTRSMARVFGTKYILEREGDAGMMAVALNNLFNIPVITVEIGGGLMIDSHLVDVGLKGIRNILYSYRMIPGSISLPKEQFVINKRYIIRALTAGVIQLSVQLGDKVKKGTLIGELYDPISQSISKIYAPVTGQIFSRWRENQVEGGVNICSMIGDEAVSQDEIIRFSNFVVEEIRE